MTELHRYRDESLSIDDRLTALMSTMTTREKVAQLGAVWANLLVRSPEFAFDREKAKPHLEHGIGQISRLGAVSMSPPRESAKLANRVQKFLVDETRLGIPAMLHEESCAGYLAKGAMTFPQAIGQAATWDDELIGRMASVIRGEMRAVGAHHSLAPVLDIVRDPRWGRVEETYGEDPFLVSQMGVAYITGLRGDDAKSGILATAKHFLGYGLSQGGLNWAPAFIPPRELREIFAAPFAAVIQEADVQSVMNAYQELDGEPAGSSVWLLRDLLRDELGFNGLVVADYFTLNMFVDYHALTESKAEAAALGVEAGIDLDLPTADVYAQPLLDALEAGRIPLDLVDEAVARVLRAKFSLGLFEKPFVDVGAAQDIYSQSTSLELSRQIAEKSIVLLQNKGGVLPLPPDLKHIAVIGPSAHNARLLQGDYHYPSHLQGIADLAGTLDAPAPGEEPRAIDWDAELPPTVTVLDGIRALVGEETRVSYAQGCEVTGGDTAGIAEAEAIARVG